MVRMEGVKTPAKVLSPVDLTGLTLFLILFSKLKWNRYSKNRKWNAKTDVKCEINLFYLESLSDYSIKNKKLGSG